MTKSALIVDPATLFFGTKKNSWGIRQLSPYMLELATTAIAQDSEPKAEDAPKLAAKKRRSRAKRQIANGEPAPVSAAPTENVPAEEMAAEQQAVKEEESQDVTVASEIVTEVITEVASDAGQESEQQEAGAAVQVTAPAEQQAAEKATVEVEVVVIPKKAAEVWHVWWLTDEQRIYALCEDGLSPTVILALETLKKVRMGGFVFRKGEMRACEIAPKGCNGILVKEQLKEKLVKLELGFFAPWS